MIRNLNYLVFIAAWWWAGMNLIAWNHPAAAVAPAIAGVASGILARVFYLRDPARYTATCENRKES